MNGGSVVIHFKGDDTDLEKKTNSITSSLGSKFASIGSSIGSAVLKGTAIAGTTLTGMVASSVKSAGELEQQIGGTEAVFGQFADIVQQKSKTAYETAGLSANEYMATINKMSSLMQGSGISQEQSMELSSQAMQRAADVASIMGIDITSAMESINGAAKGNFTINSESAMLVII